MGFSVVQPGQGHKLGKRTMNCSLIMGRDCGPASKHCIVKCYAVKAWMYPSVRKSWTGSSELLRSDPDAYFNAIDTAVGKVSPHLFRIHVSGDFISLDHLNRWADLCGKHRQTNFLAFTKSFSYLPDSLDGYPVNFEIVLSLFPSMVGTPEDIPDRLLGQYAIAYAGEREEYIGSRYEIDAHRSLYCPGECDTCGICWALTDQQLSVNFPIH
jgi:hypothetical protein